MLLAELHGKIPSKLENSEDLLTSNVFSFFTQTPKNKEMVKLQGIELYYEEYGEGEPLLLLHGWTQSSQYWKEYIDEYAKYFNVYAIDLRGHGRSSPLTKDFTIKKAANDISLLIDYLDLKNVKSIGLSFGGLTLLQLASENPTMLESMVLIGASHNYNGQDNHELNKQFRFENLPVVIIDELKKVHCTKNMEQIKSMFDPDLNYEIRLKKEDLRTINSKTLIINGDHDKVLGLNAAIELHENLPTSFLWIVPNNGHIPITKDNETEFLKITIDFLKQ